MMFSKSKEKKETWYPNKKLQLWKGPRLFPHVQKWNSDSSKMSAMVWVKFKITGIQWIISISSHQHHSEHKVPFPSAQSSSPLDTN